MAKKSEIRVVDQKGGPHNGQGKPHLQFPDPITGEIIGGQVAMMRMMMRVRHVVAPWARRQGKSKVRPFVTQNEASITPGEYYSGVCFPDHTTAAKIADNFRRSWGDMVLRYKINDKDQDRWIELKQLKPPDRAPPEWFTEPMKVKWDQCLTTKNGNTRVKQYYWSAKHPHYEGIQGFPHHFNRIDWDECQQIHPLAYGIVQPMLRDVRGSECFTGTPWHTGIGNVHFKKLWHIAGERMGQNWFRMRVPDGTNPHVIAVTKDEMIQMTDHQIKQTMFAHFLTGEGAVFSNLDRVFILPYLDADDEACDWVKAIRSQFSMPSMQWWIHDPERIEGHIYGASIDWARSPKGDWSAITVFDFTTARQVALLRWRGEDFTKQMEAVLAIQNHYAAEQLHSDANGLGMAMSDFMRRRHSLGFRAHRFGKNKEGYVTQARVLFQDADMEMIDCVEQRHEFESYCATEAEGLGSEKTIRYSAPLGEFDDIVSCFLHLAPTLTIIGRQAAEVPEPVEPPMFDDKGMTTLDQFSEGGEMPWDRHDADPEDSWDSVIIPY